MADTFISTAQSIIKLAVKIKNTMNVFRHNQKDCRKVGKLIDKVSAAAEILKKQAPPSSTQEETKNLMEALRSLEKTLEESLHEIDKCEQKHFASRFVNASDIAEKLGHVRQYIQDEFVVLSLAMFACMMRTVQAHDANMMRRFDALDVTMKDLLVAVRDRDASGRSSSKVASLVHKIADDFSDEVRLPPEVQRLVQTYSYSSDKPIHQRRKHKTKTAKTESDRKSTLRGSEPRDSLRQGNANLTSLGSLTGQSIKKIISWRPKKNIMCIDVHPTKTWIVVGYVKGNVSVWDYHKERTVMELQVKYGLFRYSIYSVKFIARKEWLVVGNDDGYIYVYAHTDTELTEIKKLRVYNTGQSVHSLAVHPNKTYLISSSAEDRTIKLWDWSKKWKKIREFSVKSGYSVRRIKVNPNDTNSFICITYQNTAQIWDIESGSLLSTIEGPFNADYLGGSYQDFLVTLSLPDREETNVPTACNFEIRNLHTNDQAVHTIDVSGRKMRRVACHPTLPILATVLADNGTVCIWNAVTCKLENTVHTEGGRSQDLIFVTDTNEVTRLIVMFESMVAIMEVNLPGLATAKQRTGRGN